MWEVIDSAQIGTVLVGLLLLALAWRLIPSAAPSPVGTRRRHYDYDVIVVGCSIAGPAVAKALSDQHRKVLVVERELFVKPDRIVGELLQPGGVMALQRLGMEACLPTNGALCTGYYVVDEMNFPVSLPYQLGFTGTSFHFGDFVQNMRAFIWKECAANVTMVEGTVTNVMHDGDAVCGIEYLRAETYVVPDTAFGMPPSSAVKPTADEPASVKKLKLTATAPLVIMCDGGGSKYKAVLAHYTPATTYHSHFVGVVLKGISLPMEHRGHVFFGSTGPILSYRLDANEVRVLVDYNKPQLPSIEEQSRWLQDDVASRLPPAMAAELRRVAKDTANIRSMPIAQCQQTTPHTRGYVGLGDHNNQRHPLTGGGMTCAMRDAIRLVDGLSGIPRLRNPSCQDAVNAAIDAAVTSYTRNRWQHAACINILSWALYAVFGDLELRNACFDYFLKGGDAVAGPMALLSGIDPRAATLLRHYVLVMLTGAWSIISQTGKYSCSGQHPTRQQIWLNCIKFVLNPLRLLAALLLLLRATFIFAPVAFMDLTSVWRVLHPLSPLARAVGAVRTKFMVTFLDGKHRKPVGL